MAVTVIIALIAAVLGCIYLFFSLDKKRKIFAQFPGPKALPLIGNALEFSPDANVFFEQIIAYTRKYGPVLNLMLGPFPIVILSSPEAFETVLRSTKHLTKSDEYQLLYPWLKEGLLTSAPEKWKSRRRILTPTFHFKILNDFVDVFNEQVDVMLQKLDEARGQGEIDIFPYITLCALDIISEAAMGKKIDAQQSDGETDYVKAIYIISHIITKRSRTPWLRPDAVFNLTPSGRQQAKCVKTLHEFTRNIILEREKEINSSEKIDVQEFIRDDNVSSTRHRRLAFLDLLLSMAKDSGLTHDDIQEEVDTFMFEGHDTTAAAMAWTTFFIGDNQDVQEKLMEEMDAIFGDSNRHPTMDDIREMKYLECVIKESLRIFPSVSNVARKLDEDAVVHGYTIPAGTTVSLWFAGSNRNPELFPDPMKFDPERFNKESSTERHPYAFVPFSAGPRNCIGQKFAMNEEKVVLSSLIRKYHIQTTQRYEDLRPEFALILRPADGIKVKLTPRVRSS